MEFNLEPLLNNNGLVVHCPEREIAVAFVRYMKAQYPSRYFRGIPGESEYWDRNNEETCYLPRLKNGPGMQYASIGYYLSGGYDIISVHDLMIPLEDRQFDASDMSIETLFEMS